VQKELQKELMAQVQILGLKPSLNARTAIGFGNYRSPQSIVSPEGADGEPFVVRSAGQHRLA
jgi:hypothetical protein